jgi:hypothetical protein
MGMKLHFLLPLVGPDFGAVGGSSQLRAIVGALLTYGLIISVLMVVTCGVTWQSPPRTVVGTRRARRRPDYSLRSGAPH